VARDRNAAAHALGETVRMPPKRIRIAAVDAPWGSIHVAVSERGVVALDTLTPGDAFVDALERRFHTAVDTERSPLLQQAVGQLGEFLRGERRSFTVRVDLTDRPAWDQLVLDMVRQIPWGETRSYGMVARLVDRPGAARAVGGAVGRSPVGIVVPCHRVIAGDGTLGGYGGDAFGSFERGLELKQELLAMEGVDVRRRA